MNQTYAEAGVKRRETASSYGIRALLILAIIVAIFISTLHTIALIISIVIIFGVIYIFPKLKVEYEYIYVDGQLDFDKIMGNSKRKTDLRIDFEQVEIMAPMNSHALDPYKNSNLKTKDYSSRNPEARPYVIIYRKGEKAYKILFEPNENMLEAIKLKNPRKLAEY